MAERKKREGDRRPPRSSRVEQLYPRPADEIEAELAKYPNLEEIRWVQDEPANMGPWPYMALTCAPAAGRRSRSSGSPAPASAVPSVGSAGHQDGAERSLLEQAFA